MIKWGFAFLNIDKKQATIRHRWTGSLQVISHVQYGKCDSCFSAVKSVLLSDTANGPQSVVGRLMHTNYGLKSTLYVLIILNINPEFSLV